MEQSQPVVFGLLRHGETIWNTEKRLQGHGDSPLTQAGRERTRQWARHLAANDWQHIVASDLGRVRETAEILNGELCLPIDFDSRLREQHWGKWEGLRLTEVEQRFSRELALQLRAGWHFRPPGGESRIEVKDRVLSALEDAALRLRRQRILVICHRGVIKSLVYDIAGSKYLPDEPPLVEKDGLHTIARDRLGYRLVELNFSPFSLY